MTAAEFHRTRPGVRCAWPLLLALALGACATRALHVDPDATPAIKGASGVVSESSSERVVDQVTAEAPSPEHMDELLAIVESLSHGPIYADNRAALLIDGPATYAAMLSAIGAATQQVDVETFIFADDDVGEKFASALIARRQAGVRVRIIYDSLGSMNSRAAFFDRMEKAGIEIVEFHSVNPARGGNPLDLNVRDHRKLVIVDNTVAFTGGINFTDTYTSSSRHRATRDLLEDGWRDTQVAIRGPTIEGLREVFETNWREQAGVGADPGLAFPTPERAGHALVATLMSEGGDGVESAIARAYREAFDKAMRSIWITQAYFVPDEDFLAALVRAARRGVDVRLIVPGVSDSDTVLSASRFFYRDLLEAGVQLCENREAFVHAKTAVIDGFWSTVGSSNLDMRSFVHNDEVNAVVFGRDFGEQMEKQFLEDLDDCVTIDPVKWAERPLKDRLKERFARVVAYWL